MHLGQTSVALFFMITAFLFWGRVLSRRGGLDLMAFLVSRLFRLYPAYLVMLGLLLAVTYGFVTPEQRANAGLWPQLASWMLFTVFGAPNLNGLPDTGMVVAWVTWSLPYEWLFYLALPVDLVPEALLGPIGMIDDTGVLAVVGIWVYKLVKARQRLVEGGVVKGPPPTGG